MITCVQEFHDNDNWNTPEETLKGVESYAMNSKEDGVDNDVISIDATEDMMTEQVHSGMIFFFDMYFFIQL